MMKVFDCQDFPDTVREAFFHACHGGNSVSNDCYVDWYPEDWTELEVLGDDDEEDITSYYKAKKVVDEYLFANGVEISDLDKILIKHWW